MATTKFIISAERCPQTLCRLLGLFAQQDRLIDHAEVIASRRLVIIVILISDMDHERAAIIAEKMRQMISVRFVRHRNSRSETSP